MHKRLRHFFIYSVLSIIFAATIVAPAQAYHMELASQSAILVEETTGKVLYEKDADERLYPASLTKLVTALLVLEHFSPNEFVVTGSEIHEIPWDSSRAFHVEGETLSIENLIRGLVIPSGNETACVAARAVVERAKGTDAIDDMDYLMIEAEFCRMMNEFARNLGAIGTNFENPHGYHHEEHYSTARDMMLISRAAMDNALIRQTARELGYIGNGAGLHADPALTTQHYNWQTHNKLIEPASEFFYPYATGIKTGFTTPAGFCLASSAERDGRRLIAVVLNAPTEDDRWFDTHELFEFGFNTFGDETIQTQGDILYEIEVEEVRLGDDSTLELVAAEDVVRYMSKEEAERVTSEVALLPERAEDGKIFAPVEEGERIATITLKLDGETVYTGDLLAASDIEGRTFQTDMVHHVDEFMDTAFSPVGLLFFFGGIAAVLAAIRIAVVLHRRKQRRKNRYRLANNRVSSRNNRLNNRRRY